MAKLLKKHAFSLRLERHFTSESADAFDLIHFREADEGESNFAAPENWSFEAAASLANDTAAPSIPANTRSREENTVPSWLWRHTADGKVRASENSVKQIFHRVAGAAAYAGWKKGVFADESEARVFFDEARYMLAQRFIAVDPRHLTSAGFDWAYGIDAKPVRSPVKTRSGTCIRNASIDALLSGDNGAQQKWQKLLDTGAKAGFLKLSFADIAADWNGTSCNDNSVCAAINIYAFQRESGAIAVDRISHAVRTLTILLELLGHGCVAIGINNLAALLMSQTLPYDSEAGRTTAAALAAVVTAEACATSAQLAGLLGPSLDFAANRESVLRALRNYRRAAYGDRNDYEKISVLPVPLEIGPGIDLALIAAARRRWDEAIELVQQHGLRFATVTDLSPAPSLAFFMESATQGIEPMRQLSMAVSNDGEVYQRKPHPAVHDALLKLGYGADKCAAIITHIAGAKTLEGAPAVNFSALRSLGFDDETIEKAEHYISYVNDIRLAFTPWILGKNFVHETLHVPMEKIEDPHFDLLKHLGFSAVDIEAANFYCYGAGTARGAKGLRADHAAILASLEDITHAAQIRMAAAMQSFISGDVSLHLDIANGKERTDHELLLLEAWRQGVKSVSLEWDVAEEGSAESRREIPLPPKAQPKQQYSAPLHSVLRGRAKASGELVGMKSQDSKSGKKPRQTKGN